MIDRTSEDESTTFDAYDRQETLPSTSQLAI